ncbi:hypothetical protein J2S09_003925 [Bacillus fengqiuensis]|nr:hypothetical protein [Bacillus fengqiuensis]
MEGDQTIYSKKSELTKRTKISSEKTGSVPHYKYLGEIKIDTEHSLTDVNKLATYLAIKAAIDIESEFSKRGFSSEYVKKALTLLAPEVIRGYCKGNLGHFAQEIVKEIKGEE